jgi:hypothetical protein
VTIIPDSYAALVDALEKGNAHIVLLDPYAYTLAYQKGLVYASFATLKDGNDTYGAQFIATRKGGFKSYFDPITETNTGTELSRVVIVENEATNIKDALLILFDGDAENGNYDTLQLMIHAIQSNITSYSIEGMVSRIMYTQSVIQVLTADDP